MDLGLQERKHSSCHLAGDWVKGLQTLANEGAHVLITGQMKLN